MDDFEYSWDFGEVSKLKEEKGLLEDKVKFLDKELHLRHIWVKHHQKAAELTRTRECLAEAKFTTAVEELTKHDPERAKQLKNYQPTRISHNDDT